METQLKFPAVLPLKQVVLRRVATHLASDSPRLANALEDQSLHAGLRGGEPVFGELWDKVLQLGLPKPLRKEVMDSVRPVALQVRRWENRHTFHLSNGERLCLSDASELSFTPAGVVGHRKTAERLVRCDVLSVEQRYELACMNCLEDDIPDLWEKLPEESKRHLHVTRHSVRWNSVSCHHRFIRAETSAAREEPPEVEYLFTIRLPGTYDFKWAFEHSAKMGNRVATEYFFLKLTENERDESLMRTVRALLSEVHVSSPNIYEEIPDVCCYLMSLLSPEQQVELVTARPVDVFFFFLDLPWLDLFSENARFVWNLIPRSDFDDLLTKMVYRYLDTKRHFPIMFREFFAHNPLDFRNFFVGHVFPSGMTPAIRFLSLFFERKDAESAAVLFRNVEAADRVKIVFDEKVMFLISEVFLADDGWEVARVCLEEAALSDEDKKRWAETLVRFFGGNGESYRFTPERVKSGFDRLFRPAGKGTTGQKRKLTNWGWRTTRKKPRGMSGDGSGKSECRIVDCYVLLKDCSAMLNEIQRRGFPYPHLRSKIRNYPECCPYWKSIFPGIIIKKRK